MPLENENLESNENQPIDKIPLAQSIAGAKILGIAANGDTNLFSINDIKGDGKGIADASTNPGTPALSQYYFAKPGVTYPNFKDANNVAITIPTEVDGNPVLAARLVFNGTNWVAEYTAAEIDLVDYATKEEILPTIETVEEIKTTIIPKTSGFSIADEQGNAALDLDENGVLHVYEVDEVNGNVKKTNDKSWSISDENGNISARIQDGKLHINEVISNFGIRKLMDKTGTPTDLLHVLSHGQSLSTGEESVPVLSISQKYDSLMINGGLNFDQSDPTKKAVLTPLTEIFDNVYNRGESPVSGMFEKLIETIENNSLVRNAFKGFKFLGSVIGAGGATIAQLSKGNAYGTYTSNMGMVRVAKELADKNGLSYSVPCITFTHGESDISANTSKADYIAAVRLLFNNLNADITSISGQSRKIAFLMNQTSYQGANPTSDVAFAGMELSNAYNDIAMAFPNYRMSFKAGNDIHFNNVSSRMAGAYYALAYYRFVIENSKNTVLRPVHTYVDSFDIYITFESPVLPIRFDTTQLTDPNNQYGFRVFNSAGVELSINKSDIKIIDANRIKISCPSGVTGGKVWYGVIPPGNDVVVGDSIIMSNRGNLRDSQGDSVSFYGTRLDNWCLRFKINL